MSSEQDMRQRKIPISEEYDAALQMFYVEPEEEEPDRKYWDSIINQKKPSILRFQEQVDPVKRSIKLAQLYLPSNRLLNQQVLMSMISQHFRILGLVRTQEALEQETIMNLEIPPHLTFSHLTFLIQRGILHAERFWDFYTTSDNRQFDEEVMRILGIINNGIDEDSPIQDEEMVADPRYIVLDDNNTLTQATLNQLILILTSETTIQTRNIASAFCYTFKSVIPSDKLLIKFRDRFRMCIKEKDKKGLALTRAFFAEWMHKGRHEIEPTTVEAAKFFAQKELSQYIDLSKCFPQTIASEYQYKISPEKAPKVELGEVGSSLWKGDFSLTSLPPIELARQITYICSKSFYAIQRSELLNAESKHRAPNISALIEFGKNLSLWAAGEIVMQKTVDERISRMKYFVELGRKLWDICNFFAAYAVIGAFSNNAIFRMTAHLSLLPKQDTKFIKELEKNLGEASYKHLREMQSIENITKPVIPLFSIVIQDLKRQNESVKTKIGDMINVLKLTSTLKIINDFVMFQGKKYDFLPIMQVLEKLENLNAPDNSWLMTISNEIEPLNSTVETIRSLDILFNN